MRDQHGYFILFAGLIALSGLAVIIVILAIAAAILKLAGLI